MQKVENYLKQFFLVFFSKKRFIISIILTTFILSFLVAFLWPAKYLVTGSILVRAKKLGRAPEAVEISSYRSPYLPPSKEDIQSEVEILNSESLIRETVEKLINEGELRSEKQSIKNILRKIKNSLNIQIVPGSNVIRVSLIYEDPELAAKIVNKILDNYMNFRRRLFSNPETVSFFKTQAEEYKKKLRNFEDKKAKLLQKTSISDLQKEIEKNIDLQSKLEEKLNEAQNELSKVTYEIVHLKIMLDISANKNSLSLFPLISFNPVVDEMGKELVKLIIKRREMLKIYKPQTPEVKSVERELNNLKQNWFEQIKFYIADQENQQKILQNKIDYLRKSIDNLGKRNVALKQKEIQLERLNREIELLEESYKTFRQKGEEAHIEQKGGIEKLIGVSIISRAYPPEEPYFPKKRIVIPLGLVLGILLGVSLAFIREFFDHTFKTPEDVERYLGLPVIGSIPLKIKKENRACTLKN